MKKRKLALPIIIITAVVLISGVGIVGAMNGWFGGGGSIPSDTMTRGLVGYWPMDEGVGTIAYDASDNNNLGTLSGPSWGGSTTTCKIAGCLTFDGTNDYVSVANNASLNPSSVTIEYWVKTPVTISQYGEILTNIPTNGIDSSGYRIYFQTDWTFIFQFSTNGTSWNGTLTSSVKSPSTWYHIVAIYDKDGGSNNAKIYINGVSETSQTVTGAINYTNTPAAFTIGIRSDLPGWSAFQGLLDEVRIYNRALSAEEIRYHYNRGGPVGYWKFDEGEGRTAYDSTDNNNDGTLVLAGSATSSAWVSGKSASALSFDGVDDYVNAGGNTLFDFANAPLVVEAWIKPNAVGAGTIVSKNCGASTPRWLLDLSAANKLRIYSGNAVPDEVFSNSVVLAGVWSHIAVAWDGSTVAFYINGKLDRKTSRTGVQSTCDYPFSIGGRIWGTSYATLNGLIDDVRIYNYARTPEEIRLDYNAGFATKFGGSADCKTNPGSCMTNGLVGYWPMDEGVGTIAYDASDNNNLGTLSGPSWGGSTTTCKIAGCLTFDGTNDQVTNTTIDLTGTSKSTFEAWIAPSNVAGTDQAIASLKHSTNEDIRFIFSNQTLEINYDDGVEDSTTKTSLGWSNNAWHHVVGTQNNDDGTVILYIDGIEVNRKSSGANFNYATMTKSLAIGRREASVGAFFFSGLIDEVRIYNRALSAEEVRYHYNRGGPVAQWKFDEGEGRTAYDSTDNNNDGTLQLAPSGNTATSSAWVSGKYGSALSFDGVDDYVDIGTPALLSFTDSQAWTFSHWINFNNTAGTEAVYAGNVGTSEYFTIDTTFLKFRDKNAVENSWTGLSIARNAWHHVVWVADGKGNITPFLNGVSQGTKSIPNQVPFERFGKNYSPGTNGLNGLLDDVRIYNYARTPEEIRLDYNAGFAAKFGASPDCKTNPGSCMTQGLVAYLSMDESAGTVTYDKSGNNNNGVLTAGESPSWNSATTTCKVAGCLNFDGVNDDVNIEDSDGHVWGTSAAGAVETWISPRAYKTADGFSVWFAAEGGAVDDFKLAFNNTSGQVYFAVWSLTMNSGSNTVPLDQWSHVVGTWGDFGVKLYINGIEVGFTPTTVSAITSGQDIYIGQKRTGYQYSGLIDEVKLYRRSLSVEEVRYHYNKGGPVAQWKFDEGEGRTAYDSTDNNNDGTLVLAGSATSSAWVYGKSGSALNFDGVDDYVNVLAASSINDLSQFTWESWVKVNTLTPTLQKIMDKNAKRNRINSDGALQLDITTSGTAGSSVTSAGAISIGVWAHVAMTYNDSGDRKIHIYVNGVESSYSTQTASTGTLSSEASALKIGTDSAWFFNGLIDDVKIYNYTRSPEQILQDYNGGLSAHFK